MKRRGGDAHRARQAGIRRLVPPSTDQWPRASFCPTCGGGARLCVDVEIKPVETRQRDGDVDVGATAPQSCLGVDRPGGCSVFITPL